MKEWFEENKKGIIIGAIIGAIIIIPLVISLQELDQKYCPYKEKKNQMTADHISLCEKLSEERLAERNEFCKDGKLYSLSVREPCISEKVYYPLRSFVRDAHPDSGMLLSQLFVLYAGLVGAIIGGSITYLIKKIKNA